MEDEVDEETEKVLFEVAGVRMKDLQGPGASQLEARQSEEASKVASMLPSVVFHVCFTNQILKLLHFIKHGLILLLSVLLLVFHLLQYLRQVAMSTSSKTDSTSHLAILRISGNAAYFFFKLFW